MKKIILIFLVLFASIAISTAQQKMPAEVKAVADKIAKITSDYYKGLAKVNNAREMAAVINKYAAEMEKIAPQVKIIEEKYGYLGDDTSDEDDDIPEDLDEFQKFLSEQMSSTDMGTGFQKLAQYYADPAVQKALERLSKVMESMGISDDDENDFEE